MPSSLIDIVTALLASGLSVIPIKGDGSKSPAVSSWSEYQGKAMSRESARVIFRSAPGVAIICGKVSGRLEVMDFDLSAEGHCFYSDWEKDLSPDAFFCVTQMPKVVTPSGGVHLYYRVPEGQIVSGNRKFAVSLSEQEGDKPAKRKTVIETRGEGGYVLAPGSSQECHSSGGTYVLERGELTSIPMLAPEIYDEIVACARALSHCPVSGSTQGLPASESKSPQRIDLDGGRPGDEFNSRASWDDILTEAGWTFAYTRSRDGAKVWRRPGKSEREGPSATVRVIDGVELFHSFSSNSEPLPHDKSISKFTAYCLLKHGGDYKAAAKELSNNGFGKDRREYAESMRSETTPWSSEAPEGMPESDFKVSGDIGEDRGSPDFDSDGFFYYGNASSTPPESSIFNEPVENSFTESPQIPKSESGGGGGSRKGGVTFTPGDDGSGPPGNLEGPAVMKWRDAGTPPEVELIRKSGVDLIKTSQSKPRFTSWTILGAHFSREHIRTIHYQNKEFLLWDEKEGKYVRVTDPRVRSDISSYLTFFAEVDSKGKDGEEPTYKPFEVRAQRVSEMMQTSMDHCALDERNIDPCWIAWDSNDKFLADPREVVSCSNGLLDIKQGRLMSLSPSFLSFTNTGIEYVKDAEKPRSWMNFLDTTLEDDESRALLQEWFGYCLVQDTRFQKMLMIVGKPGSGKGTAMRVLQWLIGSGSYCAMDFERLGDQFALQNALGKSVMIFPDARQSHGKTKESVIGTLLSISGEDEIFIDRKTIPPVTQKLNTRIVIVSNEVINLTDPSGALNRRMMWLRFPGFKGDPDPGLDPRLKAELSGILNWAIEGYHRVLSRGTFSDPPSASYLREAFQEQASPIKSFMEDMCDVGENLREATADIYKHWTIWRKTKGYKFAQNECAFGKQLISADMRIGKGRVQIEGRRRKVYKGIQLNEDKVKSFVLDSMGEESWSKAIDEFSRSHQADIIDIFSWAETSNRPS